MSNSILVIMSDNRPPDLRDYNSLAACINAAYCKKHGYAFRYYQPFYKSVDLNTSNNCINFNTGVFRHAAWSKLLSCSLALQSKYEYIVYIDSDAIFKKMEFPLTEFIKTHSRNKNFTFLEDISDLSKAKIYEEYEINTDICSGFMAIKNNHQSKELINSWYNDTSDRFSVNRTYEQGALHEIPSFLEWCKEDVSLVREQHFCESHDQFIRHIHYGTHDLRYPYFKKRIEELNLDVMEIINQMSIIPFDTSHKELFFNNTV